jgi:hypothetical protein
LIDHPEIYEKKPEVRTKVAKELVKFCLGSIEKEVTKVGCILNNQQKQDLTELLVLYKSNFIFCPEDMLGINYELASHWLSVDLSFPPIR